MARQPAAHHPSPDDVETHAEFDFDKENKYGESLLNRLIAAEFEKLKEKQDQLEQRYGKIGRVAAEFIQACNSSPDSSKEAVIYEVLKATGYSRLAAAFNTAATPSDTTDLLPTSPPAWWRKRNPDEKPDNWLRTHYKPYIDAKILTRSFFQRPGQDKAFYNALLAWEQKGNTLPPDLHLPTKSELIDRELKARGGKVEAPRSVYVSTPQTRQAARLYQAARSRRLG